MKTRVHLAATDSFGNKYMPCGTDIGGAAFTESTSVLGAVTCRRCLDSRQYERLERASLAQGAEERKKG